MCGIIGYVGNKKVSKVLLDGLKNLEYRGYDSAGIALKNESNIQIIKSVGKISNLENKINNTKLIDSNIGIAHTRWATHGVANVTNAHPHKVGKITIVHNGIIENAKELKNDLINKGVKFKTSTDTEVVAALLDYYYKDNMIDTINKVTKLLKGSYALLILCKGDINMYAIKKDSPLVLGINEKEYFMASDISAIIDYTNKYIILEKDELVILNTNGYKIIKDNKEITKEIKIASLDNSIKDKNGYDHYMLKEIMEQPLLIENMVNKYKDNLEELPNLDKYEEIHIVACGSAYYAGLTSKYLLEEYANIKVLPYVASEYRYENIIYNKKTLVILISQSGETADTIAAMRKANTNNIDTLAIVNVETSTIARESNMHLFIKAGKEVAVATTKAYTLQVLILAMLAYKAASKKGYKDTFDEDLIKLPKLLNDILNKQEDYKNIATSIYKSNNIFFIGRKIDYAICLEGSLKLKEVSYIHSESYQAGELKHGTISLIEKNMPVFAIITDDKIKDKTISNIEEVKARGANTYIISNTNNKLDNNIKVKKVSPFLQTILVVPILQLIAYETAKLRKCDIDKPKNLAKSVTVE